MSSPAPAPPPPVELVEIRGSDFPREVLQATTAVLMYCHRPSTSPNAEEAVRAVLGRYQGRLKGVRFDVEADPRAASTLGIMATPTIMLFVPGIQGTYTRQSWSPPGVPPHMTDWNTSVAERLVGPISAERLASKVAAHLG